MSDFGIEFDADSMPHSMSIASTDSMPTRGQILYQIRCSRFDAAYHLGFTARFDAGFDVDLRPVSARLDVAFAVRLDAALDAKFDARRDAEIDTTRIRSFNQPG